MLWSEVYEKNKENIGYEFDYFENIFSRLKDVRKKYGTNYICTLKYVANSNYYLQKIKSNAYFLLNSNTDLAIDLHFPSDSVLEKFMPINSIIKLVDLEAKKNNSAIDDAYNSFTTIKFIVKDIYSELKKNNTLIDKIYKMFGVKKEQYIDAGFDLEHPYINKYTIVLPYDKKYTMEEVNNIINSLNEENELTYQLMNTFLKGNHIDKDSNCVQKNIKGKLSRKIK